LFRSRGPQLPSQLDSRCTIRCWRDVARNGCLELLARAEDQLRSFNLHGQRVAGAAAGDQPQAVVFLFQYALVAVI
jgi:hypothetical protein